MTRSIRHSAMLFFCCLAVPSRTAEIGSCIEGSTADGSCSVAGRAMLQSTFTAVHSSSIDEKRRSSQDPSVKEKVLDEMERCPPWSVNLGLFIAFSFGIMFVAVVILGGIQLLAHQIRRMQGRYLDDLDSKAPNAAKPAAEADEQKGVSKLKRSKTVKDVASGITGLSLWKRINGDQVRLVMLLNIAAAADPEAKSKDIVEKAIKAYKLKLSAPAVDQAAEGLLALATAVQEAQAVESGPFVAKDVWKRALKQVSLMVKVSRAFKPSSEVDESKVADAIQCVGKFCKDSHAEMYHKGEATAVHSFEDVRLRKSGIQAYFAGQKWLEHTAILFVFLYSQVCAVVYAMYLKYRFPKMYAFFGPWLLVSRGEAMAIIVITMLMVLLLTRGLVTKMRPFVAWSTVLQAIADKHVLIHKYLGMMLVFCTVLHILGHVRGSIPAIMGETDHSKIDAAFTYGTKIRFNFNTWAGAAVCYPALTGYLLVLLLGGFWALSNERVRRYSFELFHYPHLCLVVLWCGALIAHGWKQWLGVGVPLASVSVAPAVVFYALERMKAIIDGSGDAIRISNAVVQQSNVKLEIDTGSTGYSFSTGMYCMLQVPEISGHQWHPFTIASGGNCSKFEVLFAVVGDWTTRFKELIVEAQKASSPYPKLCVRGGYGAPAQGMKDHKHIIMVGGGVGATPFLSFLSNICSSAQNEASFNQFEGIESAVFYWISREPDDFVWVNEYTSIIQASAKLKDRVSIRLCLTKTLDTKTADCNAAEVALFWSGLEVALSKFVDSDQLASELGVPTQFGRPDWTVEFTSRIKELREKPGIDGLKVAVFVCGKPVLVDALNDAIVTVNDDNTKLRLYAEEF